MGSKALQGKNAVVTGGHRGLGGAISVALACAGANIAVIDRKGARDEEGAATLKQILQHGVKHWSFLADLSDSEAVERVSREVLDTIKTIDILVNNAGVGLVKNLEMTSVLEWDHIMAVNVRCPFHLAKAFAPQMVSRGNGKIINVGSIAGQSGVEGHAAYSASKAALEGLTRVMAIEWAPHNIQSNTVAPTVVMTEMGKTFWGADAKRLPMLRKIPAGRFGEPQDVAETVVFLASAASDFICGQTIAVDGGYTAI